MMRAELNITYRCNLACRNCNRLCNMMRLDEDTTVGQVQTFVDNLQEHKQTVGRVKVVGGEPTIHPQFREICEVLSTAHQAGLIQKIAVNTNGVTLKQFAGFNPPGLHWKISPPTKKVHRPALWSPRDLGLVSHGPCKMPRVCGLSLDVRGWLPCSAAPMIVRLFNLEHLYNPLDGPMPTEVWGMDELCPDCLFGVNDPAIIGRHFKDMPAMWDMPSPRYAEALWRYRQATI